MLASDGNSQTCYVSGNSPIHFYSSTSPYGYIGSINPNGRSGTLTMTAYVNASGTAGSMFACGAPTNPQYETAYMGRRYTVKPTGTINGSGDLSVYFPFTDNERANLYSASTSNANPNDNVGTLGGIYATKFSGTSGNYEEGNPNNNCNNGTAIVLTQTGSNNLTGFNSGVTTGTNFYASFGVSSFSEFFLHGQNNLSPLPVELLDFNVNCNNNNYIFEWVTGTETNNDFFTIQRSIDGTEWEEITTVKGKGTTSQKSTYTHELRAFYEEKVNYFRLTQTDFDGERKILRTVSLTGCNLENIDFEIIPNPNNGKFSIMFRDYAEVESVQVVDLLGRTLFSETLIADNLAMNINENKGVYVVVVHYKNGKKETKKVVVK